MGIAADDAFRAALCEWIAERRRQPLAFGRFDCCTLCSDYLMHFHGGQDPMEGLRGTYATHDEAMAVLKKRGGLRKMVTKRLGKMRPMARCEAGAIVYGDFGHGPALGICVGHGIAAVGAAGLINVALSHGNGCWLP